MRFTALLTLSAGLACAPKEVDGDPFNQVTDATGSSGAMSDTLDATTASGSEESSASASTTATATTATTMTTDPTVDPDTGTGESGTGDCGDGVVSGDEICDGEDFGDISCVSLGFNGGTLLCTASCQTYDSSGCYNCGNGVLEAAEDCEGVVPGGVTCESQGFTDGEITCNPETCLYDTSACSLCGNDLVEGTEACDGADLAGQDCVTIGFEMGDLGCNAATCSYDFSGCSGGQYIQDFEGGVVPGEFSSSGVADWIVDSGSPIAGSYSAASGDISDSQTSGFVLPVNFAIAGTVAFSHNESSESNYDYLQFYVDNVLQEQWSGANATQMESYNVAAGAHTLEWRYSKDGSVSSGSDRVWVDDIVITGGVPTG